MRYEDQVIVIVIGAILLADWEGVSQCAIEWGYGRMRKNQVMQAKRGKSRSKNDKNERAQTKRVVFCLQS